MADATDVIATLPTDRVHREVSVDCFRQAMRELPGGVVVVTAGQRRGRTGFTATSVESLSAEPPRLLVCVSDTTSSWEQLQKWPYFGVNILRADQRTLADQFAGRGGLQGEDRYRGAKWTTLSADGPLILENALAGAECVIEEILLRHGHAIVIGQVRAILLHADGRPLVYWQGAYRDIVNA